MAIAVLAVVAASIAPTAAATDRKAPSAPSAVTVTSATGESVSLSWLASRDPGGGVAGYGLYRDGLRIATSQARQHTFAGLACGTSYRFGVDAFDAAGNRSATATVIASTSACPDASPPAPPTGLTQTASAQDSISLSWAAAADNVAVIGYDLYRDDVEVGTTRGTSYTFSGLACGRSYTLGVRSFDGGGNHSSASWVTASTSPCPDTLPPTAPGFPIQTEATAGSMTFSWTTSLDNVGVAGYAFYVNGIRVGTTSATTYSVPGLACGTSYTVGVDAYDAAGNRSSRASATGKTSACAPSGTATLTFSPTADARVEQAYPSSNFGTSYLRTDGGGDPPTESNLSFSVSGLTEKVTKARLRLFAFSPTVQGPTVHAGGGSWSENAVTWSTRPSYAVEAIGGSGAIADGTWVEFDVTPVVQGTGSYSFALGTSSSDGVDFDSREGGHPPVLVVTTGGTADGGADTQPPSPPIGLVKTDATATGVSMSWNAASDNVGVVGYDVYVNGTKVGSTSATSYTAAGLSCGASYTFGVEALDAAGNRSARSSVAGTTLGCPTPIPPTPPTGGCAWGTFSSTLQIWPGGCWRPYADSSPFNKPIPANPTIAGNSDAVISTLLASGSGPGNLTAGGPASDDYQHPVVYSRPTDPEYTIHCTKYACDDLEGKRVRIPVGARPAGGGDGHLAVVDQSTGFEYDLYEASTPSGSGGTLNVGSGGVSRASDGTGVSIDLDGDGQIGGATAPKWALTAGIVRAEELAAGKINHALFITIPCGATSPQYVAPALQGGTFCGDNTNRVPMGARLRLNMTAAEIDALTIAPWQKTILHALRTYGAYMGDTGGPSSFGVIVESDTTYTPFGTPSRMVEFGRTNGWAAFSGYYVGRLREGVPWSRLQLLDWNDPANH